jgi:glycosyltransferase involved in cell wall biosynthesis
MVKILYFVQLPPPVHGVSTINKYIVESKIINCDVDSKVLEIKFSEKISELKKFTIYKCLKVLGLILKLIFTIRTFRPDFVYFSIMPVGKGFIRDILFVLIIKFFQVKPIYHLHNRGIWKAERNYFLIKVYRFVFHNSIIIHLSEGLMDRETSILKPDKVKKYVVNNGVEEIRFEKRHNNNENISLLYLSNLFPEKGLDILIDSMSILEKKGYKISLNIIGSLRDEKISKNRFINNNNPLINFRGELFNSEKNNYLLDADIFIHPTTNDSFPLVILEAMQFELPVISTFEGAISEIIDNGINGILIEKGNIDQLVNCIILLIDNYDLRIKMGQNGRKKYLEKYTKTKFEENIKLVIQDITK